uniref:OMEGA orf n=1 Tax=Allomyces macrogynus TaxID=28583 RepID=Q33758_ALLMA
DFSCPIWLDFSVLDSSCLPILPFNKSHTRAIKRVGPHCQDILSIIFGSLLGDAFAELRNGATRICFQQESSHREYLLWLHRKIADLGYCNPDVPEVASRPGSSGKTRFLSRFKTWSFTSFTWIHSVFYVNGVKIVPKCIELYLTPLALAIWIQDDGGAVSTTMKIATNSFTLSDIQFLCDVLDRLYNIKATPMSAGYPGQYCIYIKAESMQLIADICKPHTHPSMYYKFNGYM